MQLLQVLPRTKETDQLLEVIVERHYLDRLQFFGRAKGFD